MLHSHIPSINDVISSNIEGTHICCNRFGDTTGDATGGTIVSALDCDENTDSKISECAYGLVSDFGSSTCQHNKDAGVRCYGTELISLHLCVYIPHSS